ncbi:hypothetical protein L1887_36038 [Cichorium endivia]|nr:hypothetical protein L1887_36038 [Cichorium endivia]
MERVQHQVLEDEEVDTQNISHSDTYWEQKLPTDYEDIIKWSKDSLQWTTKKDLYSILCEGFPINNGEEWFSLAKNGKKCHMLSARMALQTKEWTWEFLPKSRFREVAVDPDACFSIHYTLELMQLTLFTTYETYLVYKLQENHSRFELPVEVSLTTSLDRSWYVYLHSPQTPIIRGSTYQDTHNQMNKPKIKGLPRQRNDGWMEVQVWEFQTSNTIERISKDLLLKFHDNRQFKGLIVQGIEFKPI